MYLIIGQNVGNCEFIKEIMEIILLESVQLKTSINLLIYI